MATITIVTGDMIHADVLHNFDSKHLIWMPAYELSPKKQSEWAQEFYLEVESKDKKFLNHIYKNVVIATQSENIFNGFRVAYVRNKGSVNIRVAVYTEEALENKLSEFSEVTLSGNMTAWPKGLFDQSQQDMFDILKLRKVL